MLKFKVGCICMQGGCGWGEQGDTVVLQMEAKDVHEAYETAHYYMPGGWCIEYCIGVEE